MSRFGGIQFRRAIGEPERGQHLRRSAITLDADASLGADAGATLNITGGISMSTTTTRAVYFTAGLGGTININSQFTAGLAAADGGLESH